jgi:ABC-type siderophore export system fused ATPase/permease subunit
LFSLGEEHRLTNNNNTTMNNPSPPAPISAISASDCELKAYEVGAKVTDQIIALQASVVNVANFFIVITGALWVAVGTNQLKLPTFVSIILLCFHIIGAVAAWQVMASHLYAIRLRFEFLENFGEQYYPELEKIGKNSFMKVFGSNRSFVAKYARWRKAPPLLWYLIPIAALAGSVYFLTRV